MEEEKVSVSGRGVKWAQAYSIVLHPFVMSVVGMGLLLYGKTYISILPDSLKMYILGVVGLTSLFFPAFSVSFLKNLRIISDLSLESKRERTLSLIISGIGYVLCICLLSRLSIELLQLVMFGGLAIVLFCFALNFFWKISLHMGAVGGVVGMLSYMTFKGYGQMFGWLLTFLLLAGLLASARLYLGKHNIWQVTAGFIAGITLMLAALSFG